MWQWARMEVQGSHGFGGHWDCVGEVKVRMRMRMKEVSVEGRGFRCMALLEVIESSSREVAINLFRLELKSRA